MQREKKIFSLIHTAGLSIYYTQYNGERKKRKKEMEDDEKLYYSFSSFNLNTQFLRFFIVRCLQCLFFLLFNHHALRDITFVSSSFVMVIFLKVVESKLSGSRWYNKMKREKEKKRKTASASFRNGIITSSLFSPLWQMKRKGKHKKKLRRNCDTK